MICDIPVISDIQKRYYQTIIRRRYEKILYPIFEKLCDRGSGYHEDSFQMRNGDIMYIDETIVLDKNLPTELLGDFEELGKYYEAGDWLNFDLLFEVVEASAKSYYLNGRISRQELDNIFKKYGIA